ncbi:amyloid beta precursor protein binding protein 1 [Zopfochytrium polystomum]|nr:amyloid beta precursor protein binding protein 1 [Zopfochytrium polystomum]
MDRHGQCAIASRPLALLTPIPDLPAQANARSASGAPSKVDKNQKYDRQLRLWHAHGQRALEESRICLVNGTATGTEILKNLVLPGIGSFVVVDEHVVTGADAGNNFFIDHSAIGTSRAKATTDLLLELNDEVSGSFVDQSPASLLDSNPSFFHQFTMIITTALDEATLLRLAELCWDSNIPLVVVKSIGFFGYIRVVVPEHTIVESHPDQTLDLRLDCPFPELAKFASTFNFEKMDGVGFAHIPYIVILLQCLDEWKAAHGGALPQTSAERNEFKALIKSKRRGSGTDEENFDEATTAAFRATQKTVVPKDVLAILSDPKAQNLTAASANFWIIAKAVKDFVDNEGGGLLPLSGGVPDMKADTESYVHLQTIYRQKARQDCARVQERVGALLTGLGRAVDSIAAEEIERFCKNGLNLKLFRYRSLAQEYAPATARAQNIGVWLEDIDSNIAPYIVMRAVDKFYATHRRYPGEHDEEVEGDIGLLKKSVVSVLAAHQLSPTLVSDEFVQAFVRAGTSELHAMAALLGGIASQEIIKLATHQYIPLNNTLIFNGVKSTSATFVL